MSKTVINVNSSIDWTTQFSTTLSPHHIYLFTSQLSCCLYLINSYGDGNINIHNTNDTYHDWNLTGEGNGILSGTVSYPSDYEIICLA